MGKRAQKKLIVSGQLNPQDTEPGCLFTLEALDYDNTERAEVEVSLLSPYGGKYPIDSTVCTAAEALQWLLDRSDY